MKYLIALFPVLFVVLGASQTWAANFPASAEVMVVAANSVELDVTMEMLDENADSSSDIINVIELPVQAMHQERLRNERLIREESEATPLRQQHGGASAEQQDIKDQVQEIQQEAEGAKRQASEDMGQKKGR